MDPFSDEGALLVDTFGLRFLEYVTGTNRTDLSTRLSGSAELPSGAEAILAAFVALARQATAAAAVPNGAPVRYHLDAVGTFQPELRASLGTAFRIAMVGDVPLKAPKNDPLLQSLLAILRDVYPLMLLPDDPWFPHMPRLGVATFRHPARAAVDEAVASDPALARLFPQTLLPASATPPPFVFRSTGGGGATQLELLPDLLLGAAWSRARAADRHDIDAVGNDLATVVDTVRQAARGERASVPVLIGFTGLLLPTGRAIELPFGTLRPVADHERAFAPHIEGSLSHTTGEGEAVVVSYAGDIVLETTLSYGIRSVDHVDPFPPWPRDLRAFEDIEGRLNTTRLAALLAGTNEAPLTLIPTWRMTFDPLSHGPMVGWSDPRNLPGLAPLQMTDSHADVVGELAAAIHEKVYPNIGVAVRRTLLGMTSRGDPSDALTDLVIAWENLFGSRDELRFRISAAIAWVLASTADERIALQNAAATVYDCRSQIVHGSTPTPEQVQESLKTARGITLDLLRALFNERPDILALRDGTARSRAAILATNWSGPASSE
jgi:hypothetical protein